VKLRIKRGEGRGEKKREGGIKGKGLGRDEEWGRVREDGWGKRMEGCG